ncbi:MAG: hypothetical protein HY240_11540 [Actinobacteria bacterium]|nr:hypothetical protein [Actinomycetota bacterium]
MIPSTAGFALVAMVVLRGVRHPVPRAAPWRPLGREGRMRLAGATARLALAGYLAYLGVVLVFGVVLQRKRGLMWSAAWGGLFLLAIAGPAWVGLSAAAGRIALRRGRPGPASDPP